MPTRYRLQLLILVVSTLLGCVDPVNLSLPSSELPLIIEGEIKDNAASPDTIRLSKAFPSDGGYHPRIGAPGAKLWITDDAGTTDTLIDRNNGIYITNTLQGVIGRAYTLFGILPDKVTTIESTPQRMRPAGSIDSIYHEMVTIVNTQTGLTEHGLNVYVDATVDPSSSLRMRWKFNGTYMYVSDPSQIFIRFPCGADICVTPLPCAENCECCRCWSFDREDLPLVEEQHFLAGTTVKRVFIKYIPITPLTFYERYRVEVTQLELSEEVYEFYLGMRKQMQNASSLFQPPFFELNGNVSTGGDRRTKILGVFSASAQTSKSRYILREEIPFIVYTELTPGDCRALATPSTLTMPPFWN